MHVGKHFALLYLYTCSKINNFEGIIQFFIYQHVLRLDISMDNIQLMEVRHSLQDLLNNARRLFFSKNAFGQYLVKQFTTFAQLSYDVVPLFVCVDLVEL